MSSDEKQWHKNFLVYMKDIINHPNYEGLPIKKKPDGSYGWIAVGKSDIGQGRIKWCIKKAHDLGMIDNYTPYSGMYADVMLAIHPTKWKVCQICGRKMSLYYHYPNEKFLKALNKAFNSNFNDCDHISDIWDELIACGIKEIDIANFLIKKGQLNLNASTATKNEIIAALEYTCRKGGKKCLGPGAMSNFPDRFDGFHTYNRCCRKTQDKGRSDENLKSYTKDRRAYEYWSDSNIHAANQFMGSDFFKNISADHIGPISLGFVHDSHYLQPMNSSDNSSKRDRLLIEDIEKIIDTEKHTGIYPISWYSKLIWEHIKSNYRIHPERVSTVYRDALKQNMTNFMFILLTILTECPNTGEKFLEKAYLEPNYEYFKFSYKFNAYGEIVSQTPRHYTGRNINETERYKRIAIESVYEYNSKDNRNLSPDLTKEETMLLKHICYDIENNFNVAKGKEQISTLIEEIENRLISKL